MQCYGEKPIQSQIKISQNPSENVHLHHSESHITSRSTQRLFESKNPLPAKDYSRGPSLFIQQSIYDIWKRIRPVLEQVRMQIEPRCTEGVVRRWKILVLCYTQFLVFQYYVSLLLCIIFVNLLMKIIFFLNYILLFYESFVKFISSRTNRNDIILCWYFSWKFRIIFFIIFVFTLLHFHGFRSFNG